MVLRFFSYLTTWILFSFIFLFHIFLKRYYDEKRWIVGVYYSLETFSKNTQLLLCEAIIIVCTQKKVSTFCWSDDQRMTAWLDGLKREVKRQTLNSISICQIKDWKDKCSPNPTNHTLNQNIPNWQSYSSLNQQSQTKITKVTKHWNKK